MYASFLKIRALHLELMPSTVATFYDVDKIQTWR